MCFQKALTLLKQGKKITKRDWGKNIYIQLFKSNKLIAENKNGYICEKEYLDEGDKQLIIQSTIYMRTSDNRLTPWIINAIDILENDWLILE